MTLHQFCLANSRELRRAIRAAVPNIGPLDMDDIEQWIANDEGLYNWALAEGVTNL